MSVSLERTTPKGMPGGYPQAGGAPQPYGSMQGQQMPGQMPMGQQMPGQMPMGQQMPGQMPMGQQMPGQMPMGQQMPGQMPMGQQMPGQMPMGQQMPGQMPMGQQMPGQMPMGQVGMNPPLSNMPGQMAGQMPGQMGRISLVKGQNMSLTKTAPNLRRAVIGLGWDVRMSQGAAFDLDTSCFMLNAQNMVGKPQDFIFYNNRQSMDGSVMHRGDNLTGMGEGDDEQITVDLTRIPMDIQRIVFVVSIYEADKRAQNFGMVQRAFIRIVDQESNQEIVRYDLTEEACMMSCMLFGELYRYGNEWKFKALGTPIQNGLAGAGAQFGMQLA